MFFADNYYRVIFEQYQGQETSFEKSEALIKMDYGLFLRVGYDDYSIYVREEAYWRSQASLFRIV